MSLVGKKAPLFTAPAVINGNEIIADFSLSDLIGKKEIVLFFYPKDNTPGCTKEVCNLRDNYQLLQKQGYKLLGVSADSQHKHRNFIDKFKLPFPLLSDPDRNVISAYGVWGRKKFMGREFDGILRTTFVIDDGTIQDVITKVNTQDHANQILP